MNNCIFSSHCTELVCDNSCPRLVESSYLLERNDININHSVFHSDRGKLASIAQFLSNHVGSMYVVVSHNTVSDSDMYTYVGICQNWAGSRLHCNVYNLKFSKYLDAIRQSWSLKSEPDSLQYTKIWANSAKLLIISNLDYVNFGDFESQTLLTLLQDRERKDVTTILVSPPPNQLVGKPTSLFFKSLRSKLSEAVIK